MLWALGFFSEQFLEYHHVKGLVGHQLLKLAVLLLKQAQTPSVVNLHATKLLLPFVVGALADAVATAKLLDGSSGLCFLQDRDDLFFTVSLSLHGFGSVCPFRGPSSTQLWPNQRGKLKTWRREHAQLIDTLSKAGAKSIAFDLYLNERGLYDDQLITAMKCAKRRGTAVIFGTKSGSSPVKDVEEAASGIGLLCAGTKLGKATLAPLAVDGKQKILALSALAATHGGKFLGLIVRDGANPQAPVKSSPKSPANSRRRPGADKVFDYRADFGAGRRLSDS